MSRPELHIDTGYEDGVEGEDDMYDDDMGSESSMDASIHSDIDFSLNYALHTYVSTSEGQASVVKGDSLVLLDDSNSYWWLVNVLKTEEVGYIPAENIETPFERLARLNKLRNVDIAAPTDEEKARGIAESRLQLRNVLAQPKTNPGSRSPSPVEGNEGGQNHGRSLKFGAPTYVDHPGITWEWEEGDDDDEYNDEMEDGPADGFESDEEDHEESDEEDNPEGAEQRDSILAEMEPDDGMSWDDEAGEQEQAARLARIAQSGLSNSASYGSSTEPDELTNRSIDTNEGLQATSHLALLAAGGGPEVPIHLAPPVNLSDFSQGSNPSLTERQGPIVKSSSMSSFQSQSSATHAAEIEPMSPQSQTHVARPSPSRDILDPAFETGETRRIYATPPVARSTPPQGDAMSSRSQRTVSAGSGFSSSDGDGLEDALRTSRDSRDSDVTSPGSDKLKKPRKSDESDSSGKKKGVFSSLFRKKEKKDKGIRNSSFPPGVDSESFNSTRSSGEESVRSAGGAVQDNSAQFTSPTSLPTSDAARTSISSPPPGGQQPSATSSHGLRLQQIDQKQQALYHQYLASTITSPDRISPALSYGTQAAAAVAQSSATQRFARAPFTSATPRPASIVNSVSNRDSVGQDASGTSLPTLSVLRIFAGPAIESDATFKTVLLNDASTTEELLKQAIQRFRLGSAKIVDDYCLTVKGVEGSEELLALGDHPLVVFNSLNAEDDIKTVRRSSVGSISSVSSNLSLNPAIARLGDWSDDSIVKLYLHRRDKGNSALLTSTSSSSSLSPGDGLSANSVLTSAAIGSSSTQRFTVQIAIHPEDLPEGLIFDPLTEAIIPRSGLRQRNSIQPHSPILPASPSNSISQTERRKYLLLATNSTVAEAIEQSLDRFSIPDAVVDGGDDVEDKMSNRRSGTRVRYGLAVLRAGGEQYPLKPSAKLIEAYPTPPNLRSPPSADSRERRRSREIPTARPEDILETDPVFIIRRAVPRGASLSVVSPTRRPRTSVLMDSDVRGSKASSIVSDQSSQHLGESLTPKRRISTPSLGSEKAAVEDPTAAATQTLSQPSRQEVIAAQRAASRANQLAILSANANASEGIDLVMSDRGTVRSSRHSVDGDRQVRYSYIEPDGGTTYDISELIEQEWTPLVADDDGAASLLPPAEAQLGRSSSPGQGDVLQGALAGSVDANEGPIGQKLARVVEKVRSGSVQPLMVLPSSKRAIDEQSHLSTDTPASAAAADQPRESVDSHTKKPSVTSISSTSQSSGQSPQTSTMSPRPSTSTSIPARTASRSLARTPIPVMRDDFGVKQMLAVINARAREPLPKLAEPADKKDDVERLLFGERIPSSVDEGVEMQSRLDNFDRELDELLEEVLRLR